MDSNFYNDWLDVRNMYKANGVDHIVNLPDNFFTELKFDTESLKQYRIDAAIKCAETLGNKPALLLSGGIDSQAMVQCFKEANLNFDVYTFVFNEDLNKQDFNYARFYCKMNDIKCIEYEFNVLNFLQHENFDIGNKYKSISPHFNTHYKMAEILKNKGYTGVCCGGFAPSNVDNIWGTNFSYNPCYYTNIEEILGIKFQGNFLSYSPELAWSIGLLTEKIILNNSNDPKFSIFKKNMKKRYNTKVGGYTKHGFNIFPQPEKYTGFELIRKYYEDKTGDGWFFEKTFRTPLSKKFKKTDAYLYKFNLSDKQINELLAIYSKNFISTY